MSGMVAFKKMKGLSKKTKSKKARSLTKVQKLEVKSLVTKQFETKYCATPSTVPKALTDLTNFTAFSSAITSVGELFACLPSLSQGVAENQRVGDTIQPVSAHVNFRIEAFSTNDNNACDKTVHIFMLEAASVKSLDNYTAIPITQLLELGTGTGGGFDGTLQRALCPINKREFRVLHHKKIRLIKGFGNPVGFSSLAAGTTDGVGSTYRHYADVNLKVKLPKVLKYDRTTSVYPTNSAPVFCIGWTDNLPLNTAPNTLNLMVMARTHLYYKDA